MNGQEKRRELARVHDAAEQIAAVWDTGVQRFEMKGSRRIVSVETEDRVLVAEGATEAQALSNLIKEAKATDWAV